MAGAGGEFFFVQICLNPGMRKLQLHVQVVKRMFTEIFSNTLTNVTLAWVKDMTGACKNVARITLVKNNRK